MLFVIAGLLVIIVCLLGGGRIFAVLAGLIIFPAIIYSFAQMSLGEWAFVGGGTILVLLVIGIAASARSHNPPKPPDPQIGKVHPRFRGQWGGEPPEY